MKGITYQHILDYLLGKMSGADEETFLADCFADDENAEEYEIVRDELIESYVRGTLNPGDRQRFRDHFLDDPYHRELLKFSESLRESEAIALAGSAIEKEREPGFFSSGWLVPVMGAAILILIVGGLGWIFIPTLQQDIVNLVPPVNIQQAKTPPPPDVPTVAPPDTNVTPGNLDRTPPPAPSPPGSPDKGIIIFAISIVKGPTDEVLRIARGAKMVKLETEEPEVGYTAYRVVINGEPAGEFPNFEKIKSRGVTRIRISVSPPRFKNGENTLILMGKKENEEFKELKATKRAFLVKKEE